jgi:hypothetical protein
VLIGNKLQCLQQQYLAAEPDNDSLQETVIVPDSNLMWPAVISLYGALRPGISQIRLEQPDESEVVGTIVVDPNDERFLLVDIDVDTVPQNTLPPIDAIINPQATGPRTEDSSIAGVRYLLTEPTGNGENIGPASAWVGENGRPLIAEANDIVEYMASGFWRVVFNASSQSASQYVTNITTGTQYYWTGQEWIKSYQGVYPGGKWRLVL